PGAWLSRLEDGPVCGPVLLQHLALGSGLFPRDRAVEHGGKSRLFVDSKQVAESTRFDLTKFNLDREAPLRIGTGGNIFRGYLSKVRLYRRALSAEEIRRTSRPERSFLSAQAEGWADRNDLSDVP